MAHGMFVCNELLTRDVESAKQFYTELVGWTFKPMPIEHGTYWIAEIDGKPVAGLMAMPSDMPEHVPPHWFEYMEVDDVDARLTVATQHGPSIYPMSGGSVLSPMRPARPSA